ncbi:DUF2341 domain-containing protein [Pyrococcus sp. ST04]|uniref:DUF2341 domain-containing protein n=1 Tax=Pyrococcus sp. ST04 TaxID=1183377 RepID=UPI0002605B06|nr:DUF2341 domain-containing protein [Pyrococcus sp. ST04]AFK22817.1 hypothetical protein Py04_1243 [Pyrococcus sp. ST04]
MRRGFIINASILVMLIPILLLLATYEEISSQVILSQSERAYSERVYQVISSLQLEFKRALEISGKRALIAAIDYVAVTGKFISPTYGANNTIRDLILKGNSPPLAGYDVERIMGNQTIEAWLGEVEKQLRKQGLLFGVNRDSIIRNTTILIAPLDSFRIVIKGRINSIVIKDLAGKIVYKGSIPEKGYVYSIVDLNGLEDPMFSAVTGGRYQRIVRACKYAYPEIFAKPVKVIEGSGVSSTSPVIGRYSTAVTSDTIYIGEKYPGDGALAYVLKEGDFSETTAPIIVNTTVGGELVNPADVFKEGDMGVLVFGSAVTWCNYTYPYRVSFTVPASYIGKLVLLEFNATDYPFSSIPHSGASGALVLYTPDCVEASYWIESWDDQKVLIWLRPTTTTYYIYYSKSSDVPYKRGSLLSVFGANYTQNVTLSPGTVFPLFTTAQREFFVRYNLSASWNNDFNGGVEISLNATGIPDISIIEVQLSYPKTITDVQVPIYLNSTIASLIPHDSTTNKAKIKVYADGSLTKEVPFWIEYWGDGGALIWVRTDLPGSVYIAYSDSFQYTRGDGNSVFLFFDDFNESRTELEQNWIINGVVSLNPSGNGTLTIFGGDKVYALRTRKPLNINNQFVVEFRMRPSFEYEGKWNAGIGLQYKIFKLNITLLFTDDISKNFLAQYYAWGWVLISSSSPRGDYGYHVYSVELSYYSYLSGTFEFKDLTAQNRQETVKDWVFKFPLYYLYIFIDSGSSSRGAIFDWIFIRKYINIGDLSQKITILGTPVTFQFVDNWTTEKLLILKDWKDKLASYSPGTWFISNPNRYEVKFNAANGLNLTYIHEPRVSSETSQVTLSGDVTSDISVYLVVNNTVGNRGFFSWVIWGDSYITYTPLLSQEETKPPENLARAYDLEPFLLCINEQERVGNREGEIGYFGVSWGMSFFERLEGSTVNHEKYVRLSEQIQNEVGLAKNGMYYPIGLVSFMVPTDSLTYYFDEKLNNLFLTVLQRAPEENVSSVDFCFLDHYFPGKLLVDNPICDLQTYRVYGISDSPDRDSVYFFIDENTASTMFGVTGARDLLQR